MRILVTGDRNWSLQDRDQLKTIFMVLSEFPEDTILVHGAARGVDTMAGIVGHHLGFEVRPYPAKWHMFGKAAGAKRNRYMYYKEKPDLVIAFHNNLAGSKGTKDMVMVARRGETPVRIYDDCGLVEETMEVPTLHFEA